jgi:hypothetical protein
MSSLLQAISHDIREYESLCKHYKVQPETDRHGSNPYTGHFDKLKERARKDGHYT